MSSQGNSETRPALGPPHSLKAWERLFFGVLLPVLVMAAALFVTMLTDTRAGAAEFAALGIFLVAITAAPVVLIVNLVLAFQPSPSRKACFKRGMIAPGVVIVAAIAYQTGLWDAVTELL